MPHDGATVTRKLDRYSAYLGLINQVNRGPYSTGESARTPRRCYKWRLFTMTIAMPLWCL